MTKQMTNVRSKRMTALILLLAIIFTTLIPTQAFAAEDLGVGSKVKLTHHHQISYGTGLGAISNLMKASGIDDSLGDRYVFCTQPQLTAPASGDYTIDKMYTSDSGTSSILRKLVYYAKGYPGWNEARTKWFSTGNWSDDDIYGIYHIALSYVTAGYDDNMPAWGGGTVKQFMYASNWAKMKEIVADCQSDEKVPNPPKGFKVFYIINSGYQNIIGGTLEDGQLTLTKKSANPEMTNNNSCYSIAGAEFGVFKGDTKVATLITKADGTTNKVDLEAGTYTVRELKAPKGYALEPAKTVTVKAGMLSSVAFADKPKNNPVDLVLVKGDKELQRASSQGGATLEGAVYEIKYYKHDGNNKLLNKTWRVKTDVNGKAYLSDSYLDKTFDNDSFYTSSTGVITLPLGTVTIKEITPPEGYLLNDKVYETEITETSATSETVNTFNIPRIGSNAEVAEQVIRGDLEFVKVADGTMERLSNVPFKITSLTTGESHTIVTDRNGYASTASSWNKHTANTNRGETSEDGIWFGEAKPDNNKGALIYDDYEIEELSCKSNEGMNLLKFKVSVYKDSVTVPLGTLTDDLIEIGTTAKDDDTNSHLGEVANTVYITDTVKYSGLQKGKTYKLVGTLMNKETGKPFEVNGKPITAEKTFTAKSTAGEVDVEFTIPGSLVKGTATVVFEDLFLDDIKLATHSDIDDEGQTVYYPEIGTTAKDSETLVGISSADKKVTLIDIVSYKGLMPGKTYTVKGHLVDRMTGEVIKSDGVAVCAEAEFVPETANGSVDITFTFDGSNLEGKAVVAFESLQYRGREIAVHADLADDGQTVYFPKIGTTAKDAETGTHTANPDKDVTIIDTVKYEGLRPGLEYKVTGTLMNKQTGKPVENDGKAITAETVFTPNKAKGTVDIEFKFSGVDLKGATVVVFESLSYNDIELAVHADINDKDQSVDFPNPPAPPTPETPKNPPTPNQPPYAPPKTGDETDIWLWIGTLLAAGAALTGYRVHRAIKDNKAKDNEIE